LGIDPILVASHVVLALQSIVSRQTNLIASAAVISLGTIKGGTKPSIVPDEVEMEGSVCTFDPKVRTGLHERIQKTAKNIGDSFGATVEVSLTTGVPIVFNDPSLVARMAPTLQRVVGEGNALTASQTAAGEDFAFYQEKIPGMLFNLGVQPKDAPMMPPHTPKFCPPDEVLVLGVRAMSNLAADFLGKNGTK
jgi:amidohydrolase